MGRGGLAKKLTKRDGGVSQTVTESYWGGENRPKSYQQWWREVRKWPKVMEGGQLKGDGEGGWPMQLAKSDAIFMDFIWPSSKINSSSPFLKILWGPQVFRLVEVYICCTLQKRWTHLVHNHIISKHAWDKHQFGYQNWIANYKIWTKNSLRWQTHLVSLSLNSRAQWDYPLLLDAVGTLGG